MALPRWIVISYLGLPLAVYFEGAHGSLVDGTMLPSPLAIYLECHLFAHHYAIYFAFPSPSTWEAAARRPSGAAFVGAAALFYWASPSPRRGDADACPPSLPARAAAVGRAFPPRRGACGGCAASVFPALHIHSSDRGDPGPQPCVTQHRFADRV
jgi:hypothetical protein